VPRDKLFVRETKYSKVRKVKCPQKIGEIIWVWISTRDLKVADPCEFWNHTRRIAKAPLNSLFFSLFSLLLIKTQPSRTHIDKQDEPANNRKRLKKVISKARQITRPMGKVLAEIVVRMR
jgi:hypothetical protein